MNKIMEDDLDKVRNIFPLWSSYKARQLIKLNCSKYMHQSFIIQMLDGKWEMSRIQTSLWKYIYLGTLFISYSFTLLWMLIRWYLPSVSLPKTERFPFRCCSLTTSARDRPAVVLVGGGGGGGFCIFMR